MDVFTNYILPPLIGAVIGYFTNLIAVKMLFFPHEEKRLFGHRIPFTPGAIPKGKARLAKAAGKIVQNDLFTNEDISGRLLTEEVEKPLIDKVMSILDTNIRETGAILAGSTEKYDKLEESFVSLLEVKITDAIHRMDIPGTVKEEASRMIQEHASKSGILKLIVTEQLIDSVMNRVASRMEEFIDVHCPEMVKEITESRIRSIFISGTSDRCSICAARPESEPGTPCFSVNRPDIALGNMLKWHGQIWHICQKDRKHLQYSQNYSKI